MGLEDAFEKAGIKTNKNKQKRNRGNNINRNNSHRENRTNIANPSFYYYKDIEYGKNIENYELFNIHENFLKIDDTIGFELTTTYPGLLIGSGYNHPKLKDSNDDFQLGFFFDHTTGLPVISGSTIKGILKSVIKNKDFMQEIYGTIIPLEIFEDKKTRFYDAYIVKTGNKDRKIFGSDYITSHYSDEPNGEFKDPNPIKFLKILPEVTFKFQFKCNPSYIDTFKKIIIDFGLGAKTNTGYGKFKE